MLKYKFIVEILISRIQTSDKKLTFTNAQSILNILKKKKKNILKITWIQIFYHSNRNQILILLTS